jgi:hypothetical protein
MLNPIQIPGFAPCRDDLRLDIVVADDLDSIAPRVPKVKEGAIK